MVVSEQKVFKRVRSFKVVLINAEEFASYTNKVAEGIEIIYHDTSQILYTLKEKLAVQVTGTQKVRMIQGSMVQTVFLCNTAAIRSLYLKSYTASSVSEDSNTMDSETAIADTLVSENVAVDSYPGTEMNGFSWVSWVLKKYELGLAGLAGFEKIKVSFSCLFWISNTYN